MLMLGEIDKVLVIAPLRVAEDTWGREIDKWEHLKGLRISKVLGSVNRRLEALKQEADIYIINRENVQWLVTLLEKDWGFKMVVIDELSSFKSCASNRFKFLRKIRHKIDRIVGLTGTPSPNGLMDLWSQLFLLDGGERLGKTITGFRDRYFYPAIANGHIVYKWQPKETAETAIHNKISDICVSMSAEDWLELPDRIDNVISVELGDNAKKIYNRMAEDLLVESDKGDIVADNSAVLTNKLLQMANGAVYDENKDVQYIHDAKVEALEELIELQLGNPIIVYYSYKHDLDRIGHLGRVLKTIHDITEWNQGKIQVLFAHPASAGHGLNLQDGGNTICWYGLPWSLELYQQANARLHRQGQTKSVIVHHLVAKDTMDEIVMRALERKDVRQKALLDAIKAKVGVR